MGFPDLGLKRLSFASNQTFEAAQIWPQNQTQTQALASLASHTQTQIGLKSGLEFGLKSGLKLQLKKSNSNSNQMGFPEPDSNPI